MLIEFRVSNYRSICEEQILSLVPAPKQKDHLENIFTKGKYKALNAISLYGPNASGKSNLLLAMSLLGSLVNLSARASSTTPLPYQPFLLKESSREKPTQFEITFILNENRYRYGLQFTEKEVHEEWLFRKGQSREVNLFQRKSDIIGVSSGYAGNKKVIDAAIEATRSNALFLSTSDMLNVTEAKDIISWFRHFVMIDGLNTEQEEMQTIKLFQQPEYKKKIIDYISNLDLDIINIGVKLKDFEESELPDSLTARVRSELGDNVRVKGFTTESTHKMYNENGTPAKLVINWDFHEFESAGAKKALHLSGPVLWALANGGTLIIDEIEAKMHPIMTLSTIDIFLNPDSNPNQAQLIFATHDTNLLSYSKLRRDQVYFTEKNKWESTEVFSLSDFVYIGEKNGEMVSEKERPDTDKEKRYLEGRYHAIPMLGHFREYVKTIPWHKEEK